MHRMCSLKLTGADRPTPQISADALRLHVEELASNRPEGRGNGTPGLELAGNYIAAEFEHADLKPADGDGHFRNSSWTLKVPDMR